MDSAARPRPVAIADGAAFPEAAKPPNRAGRFEDAAPPDRAGVFEPLSACVRPASLGAGERSCRGLFSLRVMFGLIASFMPCSRAVGGE